METRDHLAPDALRHDLTRRLRAACAHMAPAEFQALVDRIVRTELKYRPDYDAGGPPPEPVRQRAD